MQFIFARTNQFNIETVKNDSEEYDRETPTNNNCFDILPRHIHLQRKLVLAIYAKSVCLKLEQKHLTQLRF